MRRIVAIILVLAPFFSYAQQTFEEKEKKEESLMFKYWRESRTRGDSAWILFEKHNRIVCRMLDLMIRNKMLVDSTSKPGTIIYTQRSLYEYNYPKL